MIEITKTQIKITGRLFICLPPHHFSTSNTTKMMPLALLPSRSAAAAIGASPARHLVGCTLCRAISSSGPKSAHPHEPPEHKHYSPPDIDSAQAERLAQHRLSRPGYSYLPKKILLLRHGRSLGNDDETLFSRLPDWKIPLSDEGKLEARRAGATIQRIVGDEGTPIMFYVSPYRRTKQTYDELQHHVTSDVLFTREEPRLREVSCVFFNLQYV